MTPNIEKPQKAIIFGVTGLVGREIAKKLIACKPKWKIYGVARNPDSIPIQNPNFHFISCDLLNQSETKQKLSSLRGLTHVFYITWASQFPLDTDQCCEQNKKMLSNSMEAVNMEELKHISIQTGMKHYVSLEDPVFQNQLHCCYYDEKSPRVDSGFNFYYTLEDLVMEKLKGRKIGWSVHRPGLLMGSSYKTLYNFMGSLCVYGVICKQLNLPFVFGGSKQCWEENCIDGSDSRLVAEEHIWASTNDQVCWNKGEAFNAINGIGFTWREIWPKIGEKFGLKVNENLFSENFWYRKEMGGDDKKMLWREIVEREGLVKTEIEEFSNWDFMDVLFRCPVKILGRRDKADKLGFTLKYKTLDSILYWIDHMRDQKYFP